MYSTVKNYNNRCQTVTACSSKHNWCAYTHSGARISY